ncbi:MAG: DUF1559 domain-containing protein [Planctomycetaceae bacterium]|nr:DUF1559 domain-containing protein [Planctomycetaceae bacterium]
MVTRDAVSSQRKPPVAKHPGCLYLLMTGGFVLLLLECTGMFPPFVTFLIFFTLLLTLGWAWFLYTTLPQMSVSQSDVILGLVVAVLTTWMLHVVVRRGLLPVQSGRWRVSHSVGSVLLVVLMFAGGAALMGGVHQLAWMATSGESLVSYGYAAARRLQSLNNLKNVGLGSSNLTVRDGRLPASSVDEWGRPQHSWLTMLLPYIDCAALYQQIDLTQPWDAPENRSSFQTQLRFLQHPAIIRSPRNAEGLALTSYAANGRVIGLGWRLSPRDFSDGETGTILVGEVASQLPAWGDPLNFRDPALGLQGGAKTFGSPSGEAVNIQFADGHVVGLNPDIDPRVLKALSTPSGGEQVKASDYE